MNISNSDYFGVKIVVIGGGTGSFTLLSGLKKYTHSITALVNMVDDGGSTGQLRDELGVLPAGDVRQCLVALSSSPKVRDLFNYRFDEGSMKGHAFGNLFMAALEKMTGSFAEAVELASEVLGVNGRVFPITLDDTTMSIKLKDGTTVNGQHAAESLQIPHNSSSQKVLHSLQWCTNLRAFCKASTNSCASSRLCCKSWCAMRCADLGPTLGRTFNALIKRVKASGFLFMVSDGICGQTGFQKRNKTTGISGRCSVYSEAALIFCPPSFRPMFLLR